MDHNDILGLIKAGTFDALVGLRENDFFEAKGPSPYTLADAVGRYELAKDVSAFASANGGIIVVGLEHQPVPTEDTDEVSALLLVEEAQFSIGQVRGVIRITFCLLAAQS